MTYDTPFLSRGWFVTLEGGEGAGKSSVMGYISEKLSAEGYDLIQTREPGGTCLGEQMRSLLLEPTHAHETFSPYTELCLFLAARAQHVAEVIKPALERCKIVLCDRFHDSSIAYQGIARGLGEKEVSDFSRFISQGIQANLTVYLDIDAQKGLSRAVSRAYRSGEKKHDRIESEQLFFHQKIREAFKYLHTKDPQRIHVIDAEQPLPQVQEEALALVRGHLPPKTTS